MIQKVFIEVKLDDYLFGACWQLARDNFTTAQRQVALKSPQSKKHTYNTNAAHALRPLLTKAEISLLALAVLLIQIRYLYIYVLVR